MIRFEHEETYRISEMAQMSEYSARTIPLCTTNIEDQFCGNDELMRRDRSSRSIAALGRSVMTVVVASDDQCLHQW